MGDGRHEAVRGRGDWLYVRRTNRYGRDPNRKDVDILDPEQFQLELALHKGRSGQWDPMCLYEAPFDSDYITVKRDPTPAERQRWLALRGLTP